MPTTAKLALLDATTDPNGLLHTLLTLSLTAVALLRPLYEADGETITDFAWVLLNPAGQHMLRQPARPDASLLTLFPTAKADGVFDVCCRAYQTGQPQRNETNYQADGLDGYFVLVAQRHQNVLVVNFTDTNDQERSAVEVALRESQAAEQHAYAEAEKQRQRFREVLTQLPAYVAVYYGPDHIYQFVNPPYQSRFPHRSFLGRPFHEATPESVELGVVALFDQVYQTGEPFYVHEMEGWFDFHGTGELEQIFLNLVLHPLRDVQGRIEGVLDFSYNVTEQVRARHQVEQLNQELEARVQERTAQVRAQQQLLREILSNVPAAIATLDGPEHRFSFANARYQHLVGNRVIMGKPVAEALPEVIEQGVIALLDRVFQTGEPFIGNEIIIMLEQPPGPPHHYHYDLTYLPLRDGQGQVQSLLIFAVDVSEQVRRRRQTALLQAELLTIAQRQAQERQDLYQVFEQTLAAIVLLREPSHTIEYYNPAFEAVFPPESLATDALRGHALAEVYPRMREAGLVELLDRVYATGEPQVVLEMPLAQLYPGSPRYISFTYQAYREQGRIVGVAAFIYDATEQVRARQREETLYAELKAASQVLNTANAQLTRANVDLDMFIYTASHDLRSPIANIEGLVTALRQELLESETNMQAVNHILHLIDGSLARFQTTISHMSNILRSEQSSKVASAEEVDLAALINDICLDLATSITQTQAQIQVDVTQCPSLHASPKDLRSILANLLSNALKYRAPDQLPVVHVRASCREQWAELHVQDNGLGLSDEQQRQLFQLFQRFHSHEEGTGVGLYSIRRLVEQAGGTISVASEVGVGSLFTVRLPLGPQFGPGARVGSSPVATK